MSLTPLYRDTSPTPANSTPPGTTTDKARRQQRQKGERTLRYIVFGVFGLIIVSILMMATGPAKRALVIIDVQNDFLPGGSLEVPEGDQVIGVINDLRAQLPWDLVALTQDWHPADHISFASNHPGTSPFQQLVLPSGNTQMMWPDHCVQGTAGAEFSTRLHRQPSDVIVQKGTHQDIDSYSGFLDNDRRTPTALRQVLDQAGIKEVVLVGLALDYCVGWSALDAASYGFVTTVVLDATRGIAPDSIEQMLQQLATAGVRVVPSRDLLKS
jgi:nicotinamidase/pyrazinamidase